MPAAGIAGNKQLETIHLDCVVGRLKVWFGPKNECSQNTTTARGPAKMKEAFKSCPQPRKGSQWQLLSKSPDILKYSALLNEVRWLAAQTHGKS